MKNKHHFSSQSDKVSAVLHPLTLRNLAENIGKNFNKRENETIFHTQQGWDTKKLF